MAVANQDAAKTLLMKCYLNRGLSLIELLLLLTMLTCSRSLLSVIPFSLVEIFIYVEYFDNFSITNKNSTEAFLHIQHDGSFRQ